MRPWLKLGAMEGEALEIRPQSFVAASAPGGAAAAPPGSRRLFGAAGRGGALGRFLAVSPKVLFSMNPQFL